MISFLIPSPFSFILVVQAVALPAAFVALTVAGQQGNSRKE
jgi:hypothetical protein